MEKYSFNQDWLVTDGVANPFGVVFGADPLAHAKKVTLPYDAMIYEEPSETEPNGTASGFYPSKTYTFTKSFAMDSSWQDKQVYLEFEGVMAKAKVYLNDVLVATNDYGYSQFYVDMTPYLKKTAENVLQVVAFNNPHNSRWYTGSGIYRNVNLFVGGQVALHPESLRLQTTEVDSDLAVVEAEVTVTNHTQQLTKRQVHLEVTDAKGKVVAQANHTLTLQVGETVTKFRVNVDDPKLWSPETPYLYQVTSQIVADQVIEDQIQEHLGIRTLRLDSKHGLRINGQRTKLRGACIHHDNGIIGGRTLQAAEDYRCAKLKAAGFNAIRSSHHPLSKEMLNACDRMGMLVMDELSDMWDVTKGENDFGFEFSKDWATEIDRMVVKDFNHPSVIMYSLGNEIPEIGRNSGRLRIHQLADRVRQVDPTRYTTLAINGMLGLIGAGPEVLKPVGDAFMEAFMSVDAKLQENETGDKDELNGVMGDITDEKRDTLNVMPVEDQQIAEVEDEVDIIGYNYMPARYVHHHAQNLHHVMVGSESYAREIPHLWDEVTKHPYVLGDFTWTGYDYLGEAGIGAYHYETKSDMGIYPDRLAYCGDIDLNGYRRPVSYLREIVFGLRTKPYLAVSRADKYKVPVVLNHWKYEDLVHSWTFPENEGTPVQVVVLSASPKVELFLDGKSLGQKVCGPKHEYTAVFNLNYQAGTLEAVSYNEAGQATGRDTLTTAGQVTTVAVQANKESLAATDNELLILDMDLVDAKGQKNFWEIKDVTVTVSAGAELLGLGNANPQPQRSYQESTWPTYDGRLSAAIRPLQAGKFTVTLEVSGLSTKTLEFEVK